MQLCQNQKDIDDLKTILSLNLNDAFYMYVDLCKFGYTSKDADFYIHRNSNGDINQALMRYSNTLQVFTNSDDIDKEIINFVINKANEINAPIITGSNTFIQLLHQYLNNFEYSFGYNYEVKNFLKMPPLAKIEIPSDEELFECAELIITDDIIGGFYEKEALAKQLIERRKNNFGRNLIIKMDNKIIAHIATYAEYAGVAITSGLIVHKDYRDKPYGFCIESKLMNDLLDENFRVLTCLRNKSRIKLFESIHIQDKCISGKLLRG